MVERLFYLKKSGIYNCIICTLLYILPVIRKHQFLSSWLLSWPNTCSRVDDSCFCATTVSIPCIYTFYIRPRWELQLWLVELECPRTWLIPPFIHAPIYPVHQVVIEDPPCSRDDFRSWGDRVTFSWNFQLLVRITPMFIEIQLKL